MTTEEKYDKALELARTYYNGGNEFLDTIFPELKESEDERIRTRLIALVEAFGQGTYKNEMLAYLERQKEVDYLGTKISFPAAYSVVSDAGYVIVPKKEYEAYLDEIRQHAYNKGIVDTEKKQKDFQFGYPGIYFYDGEKLHFQGNPAMEEKQKEQKPVEWSAEDKKKINGLYNAIILLKDLVHTGKLESTNGYEVENYYEELAHWLKSLPERFNLQSKQEWSEEDKRAIDRACVALRAYSNGDLPNFLPSELLGYADRLQSLLLQPPHWKPSEEQMHYLLAVINDPNNIGAESCYMTIKSLYNDLNKL